MTLARWLSPRASAALDASIHAEAAGMVIIASRPAHQYLRLSFLSTYFSRPAAPFLGFNFSTHKQAGPLVSSGRFLPTMEHYAYFRRARPSALHLQTGALRSSSPLFQPASSTRSFISFPRQQRTRGVARDASCFMRARAGLPSLYKSLQQRLCRWQYYFTIYQHDEQYYAWP